MNLCGPLCIHEVQPPAPAGVVPCGPGHGPGRGSDECGYWYRVDESSRVVGK